MKLRFFYPLCLTLVFSFGILYGQDITFESELKRLITKDHLYKFQNFKSIQLSGFCRNGKNPDDVDYLYKEKDWFVYADCKGPGVVTRIWSTFRAHRGWGKVKIEVDGEVIFRGKFEDFFSGDIPFAEPLCEKKELAHKEGGVKRGLSYVPIPFSENFRLMQDTRNYNQINVKQFTQEISVESFSSDLTEEEKQLWQKVAGRFQNTHYFFNKIKQNNSLNWLKQEMTINPGESSNTLNIKGPAVIKGIFVKASPENYDRSMLQIHWDNEEEPAIQVPLSLGFGSYRQNTFLLGETEDGWRANALPMPFQEEAKIKIINSNNTSSTVSLKIAYQKKQQLSKNEDQYLYGLYKHGYFSKRFSNYADSNASFENFFYVNGYRVLDIKGSGQVVAYTDLFNCQPELDEHIFIDESVGFPHNAWNGTGHEDHFNMAYGHYNHSSAYVSGGSHKMTEANTRIYWNSPIVFEEKIRFNWEWAPIIYKYPRRDAEFYSVVYWYSKTLN